MLSNVLLVVNTYTSNINSFRDNVLAFLKKNNINAELVNILQYTKENILNSKNKYDMVITIGGDGTLLKAIHDLHSLSVPFFAINNGHLGFITPFTKEDWKEGLKLTISDKLKYSKRVMLRVRQFRKNKVVKEDVAVNELYLHRHSSKSVIKVKASVNTEVFAGPLSCDGVIVATPTGSTAYSMAAGASVLSNEMKAFIFMPNNPFMSMDRGLVFTEKDVLDLALMENEKISEGVIDLDGQYFSNLLYSDRLELSVYEKPVRIVKNPALSEYRRLGSKMEWIKG